MPMFIAIALLVDAARQLCSVKSQILASVNSSLTHLRMESSEALYGFPYVIINCLWSVRKFSYLNTPLDKRQHRRQLCQYSNLSNLDRFLGCFSGWVETKETEMLLIFILSIWNVSKVSTLWPFKGTIYLI